MMKCRTILSVSAVFSSLFLFAAAPVVAASDDTEIIIGSGGRTGVYYPVAISICRLVNAGLKDHGIGCTVESTGGSVDNLKKLKAGAINFAIAQSDWQFHATKGTDVFNEVGPDQQLRSVFSLYPESFTVLALSKSKISKIQELKDRNVNIGNPGSGQRATMEIVMRAMGWDLFSFSSVREFSSQHQSQALCDGEVDAIIFVAGHPSGSIKNATSKCEATLVDVSGPEIDKLIADTKYYTQTTIPGGMYRGHKKDVGTFGVSATLVSSSITNPRLVQVLVSSVFDNLRKFKSMHPALGILKPEKMVKDGLSAPLHDAAKSYYQEKGF